MSPYEAAVKMYLREQDRWNQWALFFFGAIASIFLAADRLVNSLDMFLCIDKVKYWHYGIVVLSLFFAILVSVLWVGAGIGLRMSSKSWHETLVQIETAGTNSTYAFVIYEKLNPSIKKKPSLCQLLNPFSCQ
jgi:hypothetical protein